MNRVDAFLELAVKQGGSDVHLVAGQPLRLRLNGYLETVRFRELSNRDMDDFLEEFMTDAQRGTLEREHHVDFAYESEIAGRFRVNVFHHRGGLAAAFRTISDKPPKLASLGLPQVVEHMLAVGKGLVLVTGPTGSGKSTTLAGLDRAQELVRVALADHRADRAVAHQHVRGDDAPGAVGLAHQLLRDHQPQAIGEHRAHLVLPAAGEHVHDAVDAADGAVRVQRAQHHDAGLARGERQRDRLRVAHLADHEHVRILAHGAAQRFRE